MIDTRLPLNKTCNDCYHFYRCTKLYGAIAEKKDCDFYPIQFFDKGLNHEPTTKT